MSSRSQMRRQSEMKVMRWNKDHAPGTPVIVQCQDGTHFCTHTRSVAWMAGGVVPSVMVEGRADRVPLDTVSPGIADFHRVAVSVEGVGDQQMAAAGHTQQAAVTSLRAQVQRVFPDCRVTCMAVANA